MCDVEREKPVLFGGKCCQNKSSVMENPSQIEKFKLFFGAHFRVQRPRALTSNNIKLRQHACMEACIHVHYWIFPGGHHICCMWETVKFLEQRLKKKCKTCTTRKLPLLNCSMGKKGLSHSVFLSIWDKVDVKCCTGEGSPPLSLSFHTTYRGRMHLHS